MWKNLFKRKKRDEFPKEVLAPETRPVIYDFKNEKEKSASEKTTEHEKNYPPSMKSKQDEDLSVVV